MQTCVDVHVPPEAYMRCPGFALAYAISSAIDFTGSALFTTITNGVVANKPMGA